MEEKWKCYCGSGLIMTRHYDARGIFCFYACIKCEDRKKDAYRPEIFTDPNYWHDELIDEDE
jgi:hypothetical protein